MVKGMAALLRRVNSDAEKVIKAVCYLRSSTDHLNDPPQQESIEPFSVVFNQLRFAIDDLDSVLPQFLDELSATAARESWALETVCGQKGANAHDAALRIGKYAVKCLVEALGTRRFWWPGKVFDAGLCAGNCKAVKAALFWVDCEQLDPLLLDQAKVEARELLKTCDAGQDDAKRAAIPAQALGERARLVLTVLRNKDAFDSDHRMSTADIAEKAAGKVADANQFKEVVVELKRLAYVETKVGRSGGCWLTPSGQRRAEKL